MSNLPPSLLLHPKTAAQLYATPGIAPSSLIFQGPRGLGKALAALDMAMRLNCQDPAPDGSPRPCSACSQIQSGNFADLIWLDPGDKPSLGIEPIRQMIAGLGLRPYGSGATRVVVIDKADHLTPEAQNALLKLLEEPPPATFIFLIVEQSQALLVTVRSRCRTIRFLRPGEAAVAAYLVSARGVPGPAAATLAEAAAGVPGIAIELAANPAETEALIALTSEVSALASRSLFARLQLAARLASSGADPVRFGEVLHRRVIGQVQSLEITPETAATWLTALELFRRQLKTKVSTRVALERLMLEVV